MTDPSVDLARVTIADVLPTGVLLNVSGEQQLHPWMLVEEICVGTVPTASGQMFKLALRLPPGRIIVTFELQRIWPKLLEQLPIALPSIAPVAEWGARLVADPGAALIIYERQGLTS